MNQSVNRMHSSDKKLLAKIYGHKRGWVFTPNDFKEIGTRDAVASALKRHKQAGLIRQLARGLYDYPRSHPKLGTLEPSPDDIAVALAGRGGLRIQPSGAYAANLLGLSTQVPMKMVYLTEGSSRTVQIGRRQIILKHASPRRMATAGKISGMAIQALLHLGREHVDEETIARLERRLDAPARRQLLRDIRHAPRWMADIFRRLGAKAVP